MVLIGRQKEQLELDRLCQSSHAEFAVIYGRRRIGKTYLIREYFGGSFAFFASGIAGGKASAQLKAFAQNLKAADGIGDQVEDWQDAFSQLRTLLSGKDAIRDEASGKLVVFLDDIVWLGSPRSDFLAALQLFWDNWASLQPDLILIACGSPSSWMIDEILNKHGLLYDKITARIELSPFTLAECESYFRLNGLAYSRQQIIEAYMAFGGIPFYFNLMHRRLGVVQNFDRLCFTQKAPLKTEFDELFRSLFKKAERHTSIVRALAANPAGLNRNDVSIASGVANGGTLTKTLAELEASGFIRGYRAFGKKANGLVYQIVDLFTLFYLRVVEGAAQPRFWSSHRLSTRVIGWRKSAFKLVCLLHAEQIKAALGISAIASDMCLWQNRESGPDAQIDLVIDRADGIIDLCEMEWSEAEFAITMQYDAVFRNIASAFASKTATRKATHLVLVTPSGLMRNAYASGMQAVITADSLFA